MTSRLFRPLMVVALVAAASLAVAQQERESWLPVTVTYTPPPAGLRAGDQVETVVTLTAEADIPWLEVQITPLEGLELVEGERRTEYQNVAKKERRELKVKVKLAKDVGELSVFVRARFGKQMAADSHIITYGSRQDGTGPRP